MQPDDVKRISSRVAFHVLDKNSSRTTRFNFITPYFIINIINQQLGMIFMADPRIFQLYFNVMSTPDECQPWLINCGGSPKE